MLSQAALFRKHSAVCSCKKKKPTKVKIIKTRMFYDCETRVGVVPGGKVKWTL